MSNKVVGLDAFDTTAGAEEGSKMEVRSPDTGEVMYWMDEDGKPLRPWTVTYYGLDSERVRSTQMKQADRRSAAIMRTKQPITSAVADKDNIETLVAATKEWDIPLSNGEPAPNNANEYRSAYTRYRWLFQQGDEYVGNRANFLKKPPTS